MNIIIAIVICFLFVLLSFSSTKIDDYQEHYNVWCVSSYLCGSNNKNFADSENFKIEHCYKNCPFFKDGICKNRHHWGEITYYTIDNCKHNK